MHDLPQQKRLMLLVEKRRREARSELLEFLDYCWWMPHALRVGFHTRRICAAITEGVKRLRAGQSSYLDIEVPFRHGKSDISSRAAPPYILGSLADMGLDLMLLAYSANLANTFSLQSKAIIQSRVYRNLFPDVRLARGRDTVASWGIEGSPGVCTFAGLQGSYMGKGAGVLIVDDWFAGKEEARSEKLRKTRWEAITDALSRLAPVHLVIFVATSWHVDDPRARLRRREREDPDFPKFQRLSFPAKVPDMDGVWRGQYLFPERFSDAWYRAAYAFQGRWASALLDCDPVQEGGNRFPTVLGVNVIVHDSLDEFPKIRYRRGWDLASSRKERDKDDPDWTFGVKAGVETRSLATGDPEHHLWIPDVVYCREEATARNELIRKTARSDGNGVSQHVEAYGAYKDAYTTLRDVLRGAYMVAPSRLPGDKSAKLAPLEPIFDAGHVHILRATWNEIWIKQFSQFPGGSHDDGPDATAVAYDACVTPAGGIAAPWFADLMRR